MILLWPGLPALWVRGRWEGLLAAVAFGVVLNFALVVALAPELLPAPLAGSATQAAAWLLVVGFWMVGWWIERPRAVVSAATADPQDNEWFIAAQTEYLKGHYVEAEMLLDKVLSRDPADAEARLLLASIQRRTRRLDESSQSLRALAEAPTAGRWVWEIERELLTIAEIKKQKESGAEENGLARAA
jgi:uncharacterized membrane protein (DUF485 family)